MKRIIIIGGGIAGLSAAYEASKRIETARHNITLLEQADYWGGKLTTERVPMDNGHFIIEGGPDTFVVTKPWGVRLCNELGLTGRLRGTNPATRKTYILKDDRLHELPGGLSMMIPTEFGPMIRSGLLSWKAKARMGLDFILPGARRNGEETLGTFVTRRLGREAYENLIEPLMSGIYAGDGDRLCLQSTFPSLRDLELEHGGLIKGALALRRERLRKARSNDRDAASTPGSGSIFLTPLNGLAEIVDALVQKLESSAVDLRLGATVSEVHRNLDGFSVVLSNGDSLPAAGIVLATPSYITADLVDPFAPDLAAELRPIEYVPTATVSLAFSILELKRPLDGYGYVIPRKEGRQALACTWTSTKFPHRAPDGYALLRVFIGRAGQQDAISWDDAGLLEIAREELNRTLGISAEPVLTRIYRWEKAMPQYNLGHPERLQRIERLLTTYPGLALAGNAYQGIGIPDCIYSGQLAVQKIFSELFEGPVAQTTEETFPTL